MNFVLIIGLFSTIDIIALENPMQSFDLLKKILNKPRKINSQSTSDHFFMSENSWKNKQFNDYARRLK